MKVRHILLFGVFVLVVLAIVYLINTGYRGDPKAVFESELTSAKTVFIVMDVQDVKDIDARNAIYQCGTDLAYSLGGLKSLVIYAFDRGVCYEINNTYSIPYCSGRVFSTPDSVAMFITEGNSTEYHTNKIFIGVNKGYHVGDCSVYEKS